MGLKQLLVRRAGAMGIAVRHPRVARGLHRVQHQRASWNGRVLRIGGGGRGRQHVVSQGCTMRAGKGSGLLIHGHRAP